MKAIDWIDRVKTARGWDSDYRIAKELDITRGAISVMRTNDNATLSEDTCIKIATMVGERPEAVVLDQVAERTKDPAVRAALAHAARELCILCKVIAGGNSLCF